MKDLFIEKKCRICHAPFYITKDTKDAAFCISCKVAAYPDFQKTGECDEKIIYKTLKEEEGGKLWVDLENFLKNKC